LNDANHSVKSMAVSDLMPLAESELTAFLESVEEASVVEMTASGQFRGLIQKELGRFGPKLTSLLKYDGNPFEPSEIVDGIEAQINGGELPSATRIVPAGSD